MKSKLTPFSEVQSLPVANTALVITKGILYLGTDLFLTFRGLFPLTHAEMKRDKNPLWDFSVDPTVLI